METQFLKKILAYDWDTTTLAPAIPQDSCDKQATCDGQRFKSAQQPPESLSEVVHSVNSESLYLALQMHIAMQATFSRRNGCEKQVISRCMQQCFTCSAHGHRGMFPGGAAAKVLPSNNDGIAGLHPPLFHKPMHPSQSCYLQYCSP